MAAAFVGLSGADVEEIVKKAMRNSVIYGYEFSKSSVYDELFINKKIIPQNYKDEREIQRKKVRFLRECSDKVFSYAVIANILNISKTSVSKLIAEEDE